MTVWQSLIQKGLVQSGTIVGVKNPKSSKHNIHLIVNKCEEMKLHVTYLHGNESGWIDYDSVIEIDGMNVDRYCSQAGLDSSGQSVITGKKRGRKPKNKTI